jgi:cysteine desulfurase
MTRDYDHVQKLWHSAVRALGPHWTINGSVSHRYPGNLNIRREGVDAARILADERQIAFSLGSACASGSGRPSHVLRALGLDYREARSSIRLGFGRTTTQTELVEACKRIAAAAHAQEKLDA